MQEPIISLYWISDDGKLTTYRFYTFIYGGGAHGMMNEYYLTFETDSGRLLGFNDIYSESEFNDVVTELGKEINYRRFNDRNMEDGLKAGIPISLEYYKRLDINHEQFDVYLYPRPVLVKQGVTFTYQPYEKGSFADGILNFILPLKDRD